MIDQSRRNFELKKQIFRTNKNLHIVAVSEWLAGLVRQSFLKDADIRVINNGVDLKVFKPLETEQTTKFKILGVSSVWTKSKGLYDFYRLRELLDEKDYEIILVGLSGKQINALPKGIIGITRTNSVEELIGYYSSTNVFVNPTYGDTFPTTNLEALACGTPVITYNTGGSPEAVTAETGWVIEQGNIEKIANIIKEQKSKNKQEIDEKRSACRKRAEKQFDKNKCFEKYVDLFEELITQ